MNYNTNKKLKNSILSVFYILILFIGCTTWSFGQCNTPTISGATTICSGSSTILSTTAVLGSDEAYLWNDNSSASTLSVSSSGTYSLRIRNTITLCTSSASNDITVTLNPIPATPTISNTGPTTFCNGGSVQLTSSNVGATGYIWSTGATTQTITANSSGSYSVRTINAQGCTSLVSSSVVVTENLIPATPVISTADNSICAGNSTILRTSATLGTNEAYLWSNNSTGDTLRVSSAGTYSLRIRNTVTLCTSAVSNSITVTVDTRPVPSFTYTSGIICNERAITITNTTPSTGSPNSFRIIWGDGSNDFTSSSFTTATHRFPIIVGSGTTTYPVRLIARNTTTGCSDTTTENIVIQNKPLSNFAIPSDICANELLVPIDQSIGSVPFIYNWLVTGPSINFISTSPTPSFSFADFVPDGIGSINCSVRLIVTTPNSCSDTSIVKTIIVKRNPIANFTFSGQNACPPQSHSTNASVTVSFNASASVGNGKTYFWNFGDGTPIVNSGNSPTVSHTFTNLNGNGFAKFNVQLTVDANGGCQKSITQIVTLKRRLALDFTFDPPILCEALNDLESNTINISRGASNDDSTYRTGRQITVNWGDGFIENTPLTAGLNLSHNYPDGIFNNYTITITSVNAAGCTSQYSRLFQVVLIPNAILGNPTAQIGCDSLVATFRNNTLNASPGTIFTLDYGDGTPPQNLSLGQAITHKYYPNCNFTTNRFLGTSPTSQGGYIASLVASNACGISTTSSYGPIRVFTKPRANFQFFPECPGDSSTFQNVSTNNSCGLRKAVYVWDFGDGSRIERDTVENEGLAIQQIKKHKYSRANGGPFTVKLIACPGPMLNSADLLNGSVLCDCDTLIRTITVNIPPTALIKRSRTCFLIDSPLRDSSRFSSTASSITNWEWYVTQGSNTILHSRNQNTAFRFAAPGSYNIRLIVTDNNGCKDTANEVAIVYPLPTSRFRADSVCLNRPTTFNQSSRSALVPIVRYDYDFGDGNTASNTTGVAVPYTYSSPSPPNGYQARLRVTDANGCTDDTTISVVVWSLPSVSFSVGEVCLGDTSRFVNNSRAGSNPIVSYLWNFGNGQTSTLPAPKFRYRNSGTYSVSLTVTDSRGCQTVLTRNALVRLAPLADFTNTTVCLGSLTDFTNTTTFPSGTQSNPRYRWIFGQGISESSLPNPSFLYANPGTYVVRLIATDDRGCIDTVQKEVIVNPLPSATITIDTVCAGEITRYNVVSTTGNPIQLYQWDFGDGVSANSRNTSHRYSTGNIYTVNLTLTDINGCINTVQGNAVVYVNPIPSFTNTNACVGQGMRFTNTSRAGDNRIARYEWDFGDGSSPTYKNIQNPTHIYTQVGTYAVTLTVTDNSKDSCRTIFQRDIVIGDKPRASFSSSSPTCIGNPTVFTNESVAIAGSSISGLRWYVNGLRSNAIENNGQIIFPNVGTYNISLVAIDATSCKDSINQVITILPRPIPSFRYDTVCFGSVTRFIDISSGVIISRTWDFGNGNIRIGNNPVQTFSFPSAGQFPVRLTITDANNCTQTITRFVKVNELPTASFSSSTVCFGEPTIFNSSSSRGGNGTNIVRAVWDFADGGSSNILNPQYTFSAPGIYNVGLDVTDENGCSNFTNRTVEVIPNPFVEFANSPTCLGSVTQFFDQTTGLTPTGNQWLWDFGDSSGISTVSNPTYTFRREGTYTVRLTVTNGNRCQFFRSKSIEVLPRPTAAFNFSNACIDSPHRFRANPTLASGRTVSKHHWDFGTGLAADTSNEPNPEFTYSTVGNYIVTYTVTDDAGCTNFTTRNVQVFNKPIPRFIASTACEGKPTVFTNTSLAIEGSIRSVFWNFGDGDTSSQLNPTNIYPRAGTYNVTLTVTNSNNCSQTIVQNVNVIDIPVPAFAASAACEGKFTQFTNISSPITGSNYIWEFGDGGLDTAANPQHRYNTPGRYLVTLIVTNQNFCSDTVTRLVTVAPKPRADFRFTRACVGSDIVFTDLSTSSSSAIRSWQWSFGDGERLPIPNPSKAYSSSGSYSVKLIVIDDNGCIDSITKSIIVDPLPIANFSANTACIGSPTSFTSLSIPSIGTISRYQWFFGDGRSSELPNPTNTYESPSTYPVRLIVTNSQGCSAETTLAINVSPLPFANFTTSGVCLGQDAIFTDLSSSTFSNINSWRWNFGDGTSEVRARNTTHRYLARGTYNVILTVNTDNNCSDTIQKQIVVNDLPTANFGANTTCQGNPTVFIDSSRAAGLARIVSYEWNFNDGSSIENGPSPSKIFANAGLYSVRLKITDSEGCTNEVVKDVTVNPNPDISFGANTSCLNSPTNFTFTNNSPSQTISSYSWNFGDPRSTTDISNLPAPSYTYSRPGVYIVTLDVRNQFGCTASIYDTILVTGNPSASFVSNIPCANTPMVFTSTSTTPGGSINKYTWKFPDGSIVNDVATTSKVFTSPGNYNVKLIVTNTSGCVDSIIQPVNVLSNPTASFTFNRSACQLRPIAFNNTSLPVNGRPITTYKWNFGNGDTSSLRSPVYQYDARFIGKYPITLTVADALGCSSSFTDTIEIFRKPEANFSFSSTCIGSPTAFTNLSRGFGTTLVGYSWDFGNGFRSTQPSPSTVYSSAGVYPVRLIVLDARGCSDTLVDSIRSNLTATAAFYADTVCAGTITNFQDRTSAISGTPIINYTWNFAGLRTLSGSDLNTTSFLFPRSGTYNVTLRVLDANNCTREVILPVLVRANPVARFTGGAVCLGTPKVFTHTSTASGGATIVRYEWNSDEGETSTEQSPTFTFDFPGSYNVTLRVTDNFGCSNITNRTVIARPLPSVNFNNSAACVGGSVTFSDNSTSSGSFINRWQWDFGNGSRSANRVASTVFTKDSTYRVSVSVTDTFGCVATGFRDIRVNPRPTADFSNTTVCEGFRTQFADNSSPVSGSRITNWSWDFGVPGGTSTSPNPQFSFPGFGDYLVTLTVTDATGCVHTTSKLVKVNRLPTANFTTNAACLTQPTLFSDLSIGYDGASIVGWSWDFGDGAVSDSRNPTHTYLSNGTYNVRLIVTDRNGCRNSVFSKPVTVNPLPTLEFRSSIACTGTPTEFVNSSVANSTEVNGYQWQFSDGGTDTARNPSHIFPGPGTWFATLKVTNSNNCTDTLRQSVTVRSLPIANFIADTACVGNPTSFIDLSRVLSGRITERLWNFGDGRGQITNNQRTPRYTYGATGIYPVTLTVTDDNGCQNSVIVQVVVVDRPTVAFTTTALCLGRATTFNNNSVGGEGRSLVRYKWQFTAAAADTSNQQSPSFRFTTPGVKQVTLTVWDNKGCSTTATQPVSVFPNPIASVTVPATSCFGTGPISLTNLSSGEQIRYQWSFGAGQGTSTERLPVYTYTAPGSYNLRLIVTDINECTDTIIRPIVIRSSPVSNFTSNTACLTTPTIFRDLSTGTGSIIAGWQWDFGDSSRVSVAQNPIHTYQRAGTYRVRLRVTDLAGCSNEFTKQVIVLPNSTPNFTTSAVCEGTPVDFTDSSIAQPGRTIIGWFYNFGDGFTSVSANPNHLYANAGNYSASLTITDNLGCASTINKVIVVRTLPLARFDYQDTCFGSSVRFRNLSQGRSGQLRSYIWSFGDGTTDTSANPIHAFSGPGSYQVRLSATDLNGCVGVFTKTINIKPRPTALFQNNLVCQGLRTRFTDRSVGGSPIVRWLWNFGDGSATPNIQNPNFTFSRPGIYNVRLSVTAADGCSDEITLPVKVRPLPNPDFSATNQCFGTPVRFNDLTLPANYDNAAGGVSDTIALLTTWLWNFGDGNVSTLRNPIHNYRTYGVYNVTLTVIDANSCQKSITKEVTVFAPPIASFNVNRGCYGTASRFVNTSVGTNSPFRRYFWDFGDGQTSSSANPSHIYGNLGTYQVTLIASDTNGCSDTTVNSITIVPRPSANFTSNTACLGTGTQFLDSTIASASRIVSYNWLFGEGIAGSNQANPIYVYNTDGDKRVRLIVTDVLGCSDTIIKTINVKPLPRPAFTALPVCRGSNTIFFNISTPNRSNISGFKWYFGDGDSSVLASPTHRFRTADTFQVKLITYAINGCKDSIIQSVVVNQPPISSFQVFNNCIGEPTRFSNISTGPETSIFEYQWNFGDGNSASGPTVSHRYNATGDYNVRLIIINGVDCNDTLDQKVRIYTKPIADFSSNRVCNGKPTQFTNLSRNSDTLVNRWEWNFGDGGVSELQNPFYTYNLPGIYNVKLKVFTINGCVDSVFKNVRVDTLPDALFSFSNVCFGTPADFRNLSIARNSEFIRYRWNMGNGVIFNTRNVFYTYPDAGRYNVTLAILDTNGCKDSLTQEIEIYQKPNANFTAADVCFDSPTQFRNLSNAGLPGFRDFQWFFGDNSVSTEIEPSHRYRTPGLYAVTLIVTNNDGCSDTISKIITVNPKPRASFIAARNCFGTPTRFIDETQFNNNPIRAWRWRFGDSRNTTSFAQSPSFVYQAPGVYRVQLLVTDINGCSDSLVKDIIVDTTFQSDFTVRTTCIGDSARFTNTTRLTSGNPVSITWDFGDGTTSTMLEAAHQYTVADTFIVRLTILDDNGCRSVVSKPVIINPLPDPDFTVVRGCQNSITQFLGFSRSATAISTYNWNFGGAGGSSLANPFFIFPNAGTFNVSLTVTDTNGCINSISKQVVISPQPIANFTVRNGCFGNNTSFSNTSFIASGGSRLVSNVWDFGNGVTSVQTNPIYRYTVPGSYQVKLIVTDSSGCSDTIVKPVVISPGSVAAFVASKTCIGQPTLFTNRSTNPATLDTIAAYFWDFADGIGRSTEANPTYLYQTAGTYPVKLVITSRNGCKDSVTNFITIGSLPIISLSTVGNCQRSQVLFTASGEIGKIRSFQWNFGDGNQSELPNPEYVYQSPGNYNISLIVIDTNGCTKTISRSISILPQPVATFSNTTVCQGLTTQFTDGTNVQIPQRKVSWFWEFGDGDTSFLQNPLHTYDTSGNYLVRLVVTTNSGCKDTIENNVIVKPLPFAGFEANNVCFGDTTRFLDQSFSRFTTGAITSRMWNFGDGRGTSTAINPRYRYSVAGTYLVRLTVSDNSGCSEIIEKQVSVYQLPTASFAVNDGCAGKPISFTNTSFTSPGSKGIARVQWNFNGNSSAEYNPSFTFGTAGTYSVSLTIIDSNGCTNNTSRQVVVKRKPIARFFTSVACQGATVFLRDSSIATDGNILTWLWKLGEDTLSNERFPIVRFDSAGIYRVTLFINDINGCTDSITNVIRITPKPLARFSYSPTCLGEVTQFTNLSQLRGGGANFTRILWNFGNGNTSNLNNPSQNYTLPGSYLVTLTVTDNLGCIDVDSQFIYIKPLPDIKIRWQNVCAGDPIQFVDSSDTFNGNPIAWQWQFANLGSSTIQNPRFRFNNPGVYKIKLRVTDSSGCQNLDSTFIRIVPKPVAIIRSSEVCNNSPVSFTSASTTANGRFVSWLWQFGDGGESGLENPSHSYANPGTYQVRLRALDAAGCQHDTSKIIIVDSSLVANYAYSAACIGSPTLFRNTSILAGSPIISYRWDFGDGNRAFIENPTHTYLTADTFKVSLIVLSLRGCSDTIVKDVISRPLPNVSFRVADTVCLGAPIRFLNTSSDSSNVSWSFGNGFESSNSSPSYTFNNEGNFRIRLAVTNAFGCTDSTSKTITVLRFPQTRYVKDIDSSCGPVFVQFRNSTVGYASSFLWDFGNGQSSTLRQPNRSYRYEPGMRGDTIYRITLVAFNQCGAFVYRDSIKVYPQPIARMSISDSAGCSPFRVTFVNNSIGLPTAYTWKTSNGLVFRGNTLPPQAFTTNLTDTIRVRITLIAENDCGTDSISKFVTVYPNKVRAFFNADRTFGCPPLRITFRNFSSGTTFVRWNFADGGVSGNPNPVYTFRNPGTYRVQMVASDGCSNDTAFQVIRVFDTLRATIISVTDTVCAGKPWTARLQGNNIGGVTWDFNDGTTSTLSSVSHIFQNPGTYLVRLTGVTASNGCNGSSFRQVVVKRSSRSAFIITDTLLCSRKPIFFQNQSDSAVRYLWQFGDGGTSIAENPTHIFNRFGAFTVRLIAYNASGCADTSQRIIVIKETPRVAFIPTFDFACNPPSTFRFINNSRNAEAYYWDFGNGTVSRSLDGEVTYSERGTYNVRLVIFNANGCSDTLVRQVVVQPLNVARAEVAPEEGCQPLLVRFVDRSENADSVLYDFGDGNTSTDRNPIHIYNQQGAYFWRMITFKAGVCSDTFAPTNPIVVYPKPSASFIYNQVKIGQEFSSEILFRNQSIGSISYSWDFGDGFTSIEGDSVSHRYRLDGEYEVTLIATSIDGCSDTVKRIVLVRFFRGLTLPNAIAPNDPNPDVRVFKPAGAGLANYKLEIYDKWGNRIFETDKLVDGYPAEAWDGTFEGKPCPSGSYVWKVEAVFKDGVLWEGQGLNNAPKRKVGTITILK